MRTQKKVAFSNVTFSLFLVIFSQFFTSLSLYSADPARIHQRLLDRYKKGELATDPAQWGKVTLDREDLKLNKEPSKDSAALVTTITNIWSSWIRQDPIGFSANASKDLIYISQQTGKHAVGLDKVLAVIKEEWSAYERPAGTIAMRIEIKECIMEIHPDVAKVQYWLKVKGGYRWGFSDHVLVKQFYRKIAGVWKLNHHLDSWGLGYDLENKKPGRTKFNFDFVYPVKDLKRALAFYVPLLGKPEYKDKDRASFNLEGPRFHLDTSTLDGLVEIKTDLPSGYAIIYVDDLARMKERLEQSGIEFPGKIQTRGQDQYLICQDPSKNIFLLMEKRMMARIEKGAPPAPSVTVSKNKNVTTTLGSQVITIMEAWLRADLGTIGSFLVKDSSWFDDTRSKSEGPVYGIENISNSLKQTWNRYDRLNLELMVAMKIDFLAERKYDKWKVISYRMVLTGKGSHRFTDTSLVTQVFTGTGKDAKLLSTSIVRASKTGAPVVELDYTGYPVSSLKDAERFYSDILQLGNPYKDSAYRGYWANNSVFGIYTAKLRRDGMPRPGKSNGYVSFWVNSSQEVYDYLKKTGSRFPKIPAINTKIGIDPQPGYTPSGFVRQNKSFCGCTFGKSTKTRQTQDANDGPPVPFWPFFEKGNSNPTCAPVLFWYFYEKYI